LGLLPSVSGTISGKNGTISFNGSISLTLSQTQTQTQAALCCNLLTVCRNLLTDFTFLFAPF
jgi:hypothetical protein